MAAVKHIDIGKDFSMTPGPRYRSDGAYSGQQFREDILEPAMRDRSIDIVVVGLDSPVGFGVSFLEESFGGLVREFGLAAVRDKIRFLAVKRAFLLRTIEDDMIRAAAELQVRLETSLREKRPQVFPAQPPHERPSNANHYEFAELPNALKHIGPLHGIRVHPRMMHRGLTASGAKLGVAPR